MSIKKVLAAKYRLSNEDVDLYVQSCNDLIEGLIGRGVSFELDGLFKVTHDNIKANKHRKRGVNKKLVDSTIKGTNKTYFHRIDMIREADKVVSNYPKYVPYEPQWWLEKYGFVGLTSKEISVRLKTWYKDERKAKEELQKQKQINESNHRTTKTKKPRI